MLTPHAPRSLTLVQPFATRFHVIGILWRPSLASFESFLIPSLLLSNESEIEAFISVRPH